MVSTSANIAWIDLVPNDLVIRGHLISLYGPRNWRNKGIKSVFHTNDKLLAQEHKLLLEFLLIIILTKNRWGQVLCLTSHQLSQLRVLHSCRAHWTDEPTEAELTQGLSLFFMSVIWLESYLSHISHAQKTYITYFHWYMKNGT
jgi:hypothetical protein